MPYRPAPFVLPRFEHGDYVMIKRTDIPAHEKELPWG